MWCVGAIDGVARVDGSCAWSPLFGFTGQITLVDYASGAKVVADRETLTSLHPAGYVKMSLGFEETLLSGLAVGTFTSRKVRKKRPESCVIALDSQSWDFLSEVSDIQRMTMTSYHRKTGFRTVVGCFSSPVDNMMWFWKVGQDYYTLRDMVLNAVDNYSSEDMERFLSSCQVAFSYFDDATSQGSVCVVTLQHRLVVYLQRRWLFKR